MKLCIREAIPSDANALRSLIQEIANFHNMPKAPKVTSSQLESDMRAEKVHSLIATVDEQPIGYAMYYVAPSSNIGKYLYLDDLYVQKEFRSKKIGTGLMHKLAEIGVTKQCNSIDLTVQRDNKRAISLYDRLGFVDLTDGPPGFNLWIMERSGYTKLLAKAKEKYGREQTMLQFSTILEGRRISQQQAHDMANNWFALRYDMHHYKEWSPSLNHPAITELFRTGELGTIVARYDQKVVGMALFHQKAYSSWKGQYLSVDGMMVQNKEIRLAVAAEIVKIAKSVKVPGTDDGYPKIGWTTRKNQGCQCDEFLESLNAENTRKTTGWLLFRLGIDQWSNLCPK